MNTVLKTPKPIKTIITLFNVVKSELFITLDHAERNLEMFISEQQSSASLQQFIQALQQIRGSLELIEIPGATLVANLMIENASIIPEELTDDHKWDTTLHVISTSILTLRHYLENIINYPSDLSELLLPTINNLRALTKQPALPDSYFTDIKIHTPTPPTAPVDFFNEALFGRLRQMYQVGLLGFIQDENRQANLRMMVRAIDRIQTSLTNEEAIRLCWVTAAALEAFIDSNMVNTASCKKLFSRVDQQLRKTQINNEPINETTLKELLYLVIIDNALGTKAFHVFTEFNLVPLPYNYSTLESEAKKLAGPSQGAINSFSEAVCEELLQIKLLIDQFLTKTDEDQSELITSLLNALSHLMKTLSVVGFSNVEKLLKAQLTLLEEYKNKTTLSRDILDKLADVILYVESTILHYENTALCDNTQTTDRKNHEQEDCLNQYLKQGKTLAIKESQAGIIAAQQNIIGYIESKGDKQYLEKMPTILNEVYGCLLFLDQIRAAKIVRQCSYYIEHNLQQENTLPQHQEFDNLADILASLEYFIETEMSMPNIIDSKVLDVAEESLATFNLPDIKTPLSDTTAHKETQSNKTTPIELALSKLLINNQIIIEDEATLPSKQFDKSEVATNEETSNTKQFAFSDEPPLLEKPLDFTIETQNSPITNNTTAENNIFDIANTQINSMMPSDNAELTDLDFTWPQDQTDLNISNQANEKASKNNITNEIKETLKQVNELKESTPETPAKHSYTGLSLEPMNEQHTKGSEQITSEKNENDDIKFTRPTNWELL